jgi:diguanylate cyclase (GGDEF)-like protein
MRSKLALAITLWGWLLFITWLSYDYALYEQGWIAHIFHPAYSYEIDSFYVLICLIPFLYTFLGYLVNEREIFLRRISESEEKFRSLSLRDELTNLLNRRGFHFLAEQQLKISNRTRQRMLLLFADVDNLKSINDDLGHKRGDKTLMDIASILRKHIRQADLLARVSGDEFVALIRDAAESLPQVLSGRIEESLQHFNGEGADCKHSLSIGFAWYDPECPCSLEELLTVADENMYKQKREKKEQTRS